MTGQQYTRDQFARAFELLAEEERQHQAQTDGFWERVIPRPWGPGIQQAIEEHDSPAPVDVADMDMIEYAKHRDRLGVKDSNGLLGTEVHPYQRTRPMTRTEGN